MIIRSDSTNGKSFIGPPATCDTSYAWLKFVVFSGARAFASSDVWLLGEHSCVGNGNPHETDNWEGSETQLMLQPKYAATCKLTVLWVISHTRNSKRLLWSRCIIFEELGCHPKVLLSQDLPWKKTWGSCELCRLECAKIVVRDPSGRFQPCA